MTRSSAHISHGPVSYIMRHWRGQLPALQTLGLNCLGLRVLIHWCDAALPLVWTSAGSAILGIIYIIFIHGLVQVWQIVGLWRYIHHFGAAYNSFYWMAGTVLGSMLAGALSLGTVWTFVSPLIITSEEIKPNYTLAYDTRTETIRLTGQIEPGITRALQAFLKNRKDARTIILESQGGNVYEGRGLAQTILKAGLATHVTGTCYSACTLAYIGGRTRTLGPNAQLGFHRYRLEITRYHTVVFDIEAEQEKDKALFASQSVAAEFIEKIHTTEAGEIWIPDHQELSRARVISALP